MAGKRGPSAMMRRNSGLRLVPSTSRWKRAKNIRNDLGWLHIRGERSRAHPLHDRRHGTTHEVLKQGLLVLEVKVERALGDAGASGDVLKPRRLVTLGGKDRQGGVEDGLPPRLRLRPTALAGGGRQSAAARRARLASAPATSIASPPFVARARRCRSAMALLLL